MISATEAAERLGVSRQRVNQLLQTGKLGGARLSGGAWMVDEDSIRDRLERLAAEAGQIDRRTGKPDRREKCHAERRNRP